jgi:hypothetical protein
MKPLIGIVAAMTLLAGCGDSTSVAIHQPGQYKGPRDPLLDTTVTSEHRERLANRLEMVQTDR